MNANYLQNIRSDFELTNADREKATALYGKYDEITYNLLRQS